MQILYFQCNAADHIWKWSEQNKFIWLHDGAFNYCTWKTKCNCIQCSVFITYPQICFISSGTYPNFVFGVGSSEPPILILKARQFWASIHVLPEKCCYWHGYMHTTWLREYTLHQLVSLHTKLTFASLWCDLRSNRRYGIYSLYFFLVQYELNWYLSIKDFAIRG